MSTTNSTPKINQTPEDPNRHSRLNNYIAIGGLFIAVATFYFTFIKNKATVIEPATINQQQTKGLGKYPFTAMKYINNSDLQSLSTWERDIMRNEIYARHGYIFKKNPEIINYFNSQSWYASISNKTSDQQFVFNTLMNDFERSNVNLIMKYDK